MSNATKKFTQAQRMALLEGYAASGLSVRQYAALNTIGHSTLTAWASKAGVSLRKRPEKSSSVSPSIQASKSSRKAHEGDFSLIEIIGQAPVSCAPASSHLGMEIRMPNGVSLKVEQIPLNTLLPQIVKFAKELGGV